MLKIFFSDYYSPLSIDERKYGKLILDNGDIKNYNYKDRFKLEREFNPIGNTESYNVNVLNINNNDIIIKFVDEKISSNEFVRNIENNKFGLRQLI